MSIMNDALRKKGEERRRSAIALGTFGKKEDRRFPGNGRGKRILVIALVVMAVAAGIGFYYYGNIGILQPQSPTLVAEPSIPSVSVDSPQDLSPADPPTGSAAATTIPEAKSPESTPIKTPPPAEQVHSEPISGKGRLSTTEDTLDSAITESKPLKKNSGVENISPVQPSKKSGEKKENSAEQFYLKALSYHRQGRLSAAIDLYQTLLKENPQYTPARFNLATAYIQTGEFAEAYLMLKTIDQQDPGNPDILLNMAISKIGLGDFQEASALLNAAESKKAPVFELSFHRGVIFSRSGQLEEALRWYRIAEGINPNHDRLLLNIAIVYDKLRQYNSALQYYRLFLKQSVSESSEERETIAARVQGLQSHTEAQRSAAASSKSTENQ